ncbi:hypothetical protein GQ53DRAFT_774062 [Thozetella sp. PMI_491]|nr:hypothetical protein GQ53DRAFT_774062 [Thozetella sp. PMI_491]
MYDDHSPFAAFRGHPNEKLARIAEEHLQQDLEAGDREKLKQAARTVSTGATVGSLIGMGIGLALAWRVRANRLALFNAFKATEKPVEVVFAGGRKEAIPNLEPLLQPTAWGDVATYTFFGLSGLFLGGESGFLVGSSSATRSISKDPESRARIEAAFRKFRADVLREQIKALEGRDQEQSSWDQLKSEAASMASSLRG